MKKMSEEKQEFYTSSYGKRTLADGRILFRIRLLNAVMKDLYSVFSESEFLIPKKNDRIFDEYPRNTGLLTTKCVHETNFILDGHINCILEEIMNDYPYLEYIAVESLSGNNDKYLDKVYDHGESFIEKINKTETRNLIQNLYRLGFDTHSTFKEDGQYASIYTVDIDSIQDKLRNMDMQIPEPLSKPLRMKNSSEKIFLRKEYPLSKLPRSPRSQLPQMNW